MTTEGNQHQKRGKTTADASSEDEVEFDDL